MLEVGTKVIITAVPAPMYDCYIGKEAKVGAHVGEVTGHQQFLVDGSKALYLPEESVKPM